MKAAKKFYDWVSNLSPKSMVLGLIEVIIVITIVDLFLFVLLPQL